MNKNTGFHDSKHNDNFEGDELGWVAADVQCEICTYIQTSVFHFEATSLECAKCGHMTPTDVAVIKYHDIEASDDE